MKYLAFTASITLLLTGCTQAMDDAWQSEWQRVQAYDYRGTLTEFVGINALRTSPEEAVVAMDQTLCLHADAHDREITVSGVNDRTHYRHCLMTPSLGPAASRLHSRQ